MEGERNKEDPIHWIQSCKGTKDGKHAGGGRNNMGSMNGNIQKELPTRRRDMTDTIEMRNAHGMV